MALVGHISWQEALRAGRVLFGASFADASLASGIWRRDLKRAFRRRAMETHPDRARALGRAERELAREFDAVRVAYRLLASLEALPPRVTAQARPAAPRAQPPP
ncbi:MAG TPA: J domain-containing protein, partial [Anaeromyxobacteraceae bacterium]|nr:J domain-containing protein [Anaeromyxobacteraceae bacterium]